MKYCEYSPRPQDGYYWNNNTWPNNGTQSSLNVFLIIERAAEKVSKSIMLLKSIHDKTFGENEQRLVLSAAEMLKHLTIFIIAAFLII
jgi:hypothetical protein